MNLLTIIESPYAGDVEANLTYARACMKDSLHRKEYPFASHLLYTQPGILDDTVSEERELGIQAGFAWGAFAHTIAFYMDKGMSSGMKKAYDHASRNDCFIVFRTLGTRCVCHLTDVDEVWRYETPDPSGISRQCKLCHRVQNGTFPGQQS